MKEYAEILRAIGDGRDVQIFRTDPTAAGTWTYIEAGTVLRMLGQGYKPRLRVKPYNTIEINGHAVPKPLRVAPVEGDRCWVVALSTRRHQWGGFDYDKWWLARGLCHATKEAAEQHARALLSFTTTEGQE